MPFLARVPDERHPGRLDGEALRPGWIAQPVCAGSAAAFGLGAALLTRGMRGADRWRGRGGRVLAVALAANALGSAGFHGPGDRFSRMVHDTSLVAMVTMCAAGAAVGGRDRGPAVARELAAPALLLLGGAVAGRVGRAGGPCHRPEAVLQGHALWHVLAAAAVTLAGRRMFGPPRRRLPVPGGDAGRSGRGATAGWAPPDRLTR